MTAGEMGEGEGLTSHVRFLKRVMLFLLAMAILIPTVICIILGRQFQQTREELSGLQVQAIKAAAVYDVDDLQSIADAGEDMAVDRYTGSGVNVSKRDTGATVSNMGQSIPEAGSVRKVYLTFDDGPSSNTGRILDTLAKYDVKATFFVVGNEEESYQALYKRIVEEGHTLGMHSYSHRYNEIYQSLESYAQDMTKLQEFLYNTTGVWCRYCRFPGGSSNTVSRVGMQELIDYLDKQDIIYFDWNIASGDASSSYISTEAIINNCMSKLPGYQDAVILMHDAAGKNTTVEALPILIERIQAMDNTVLLPITEDTEPIRHVNVN